MNQFGAGPLLDNWSNNEPIVHTNYNECVDHLVNNMTKSEPPFDTQAYANYKALVDKKREEIDGDNLIESIYKLGYQIDQSLTRILDRLDYIIGGENEEEYDNPEQEITIDPLTHKVTYNRETNVYNVVKK